MKRASSLLMLVVAFIAGAGGFWLLMDRGPAIVSPVAPTGGRDTEAIETGAAPPAAVDPASGIQRTRDPGLAAERDPEGGDPDAPAIDLQGPPGSIHGRILDPNGNPAPDAEVELVRGPSAAVAIPSLWTKLNLVVRTDPTGVYRFPTVAPNDDYIVVANHPEFGECEAGPIIVPPATDKDAGDLRLREGILVQGYVRFDGRPVQNAVISLSNAMERLHKLRPDLAQARDIEPFELNTVTDANGHYEFASAPFTTFEITAKADGLSRMTKASQSGIFGGSSREHEINFDLTVAARLSGQVVDQSKNGIDGVKVTATIANQSFRCEMEAETDSAGRFTLEGLALGDYFVSATCDGYSEVHQQQVAANRNDLLLEMRVQGSCLGVVVDEETGAPITEFTLAIQQQQKARGPIELKRNLRYSDSLGRFEVKNLDPGTYTIEGSASGYAASLSQEFEVERGESAAGVRVSMNRGGKVVGMIQDRDGKPIRNALVELRDNGTRDNPVHEIFDRMGARGPSATKVRTKEDGRFTLDLIVPETYQVSVKHNQYAATAVDDVVVTKGETTDVGVLVMLRGGRIAGRAFDLDGQPLKNATITAVADKAAGYKTTRTDADGFYELGNLNDGRYSVTINSFQTNPPQNPLVGLSWAKNSRQVVDVVDGADLNVDLRLVKNDPNKPAATPQRGGTAPPRRERDAGAPPPARDRDNGDDEDESG